MTCITHSNKKHGDLQNVVKKQLSRANHKFLKKRNKKHIVKTYICILMIAVIAISHIPANATEYDVSSNGQKTSINLDSKDTDSTVLLPQIKDWNLEYSTRDGYFEKEKQMHLALWMKYTTENTISDKKYDDLILFGGVEIWDIIHRWESGLTWPGRPSATLIEQKDIQILDEVTGRLITYQMPNTEKTDAVLYWVKEIPYINSHNGIERKYVHLVVWSNVDYLVSLGLVDKVDDAESIEKLFLMLARPMAAYWNQKDISLHRDPENSLELSGVKYQSDAKKSASYIIPIWIQDAANDWAKLKQNNTDSNDFVYGIKFLLDTETLNFEGSSTSDATKENIMGHEKPHNHIPSWFKNNVVWWQTNQISEQEILNALQFMLDTNIIKLGKSNDPKNDIFKTKYDPNRLLVDANLLSESYDFIGALRIYDDIIRDYPDHAPTIIGKANTLLAMKQTKDAIEQYDKALKIQMENINAINGKANAFASEDMFEIALDLYDQSLKIDPKNINAMLGKGSILVKIGEEKESISLVDKILEIEPDNVHAKKLKEKYG